MSRENIRDFPPEGVAYSLHTTSTGHLSENVGKFFQIIDKDSASKEISLTNLIPQASVN